MASNGPPHDEPDPPLVEPAERAAAKRYRGTVAAFAFGEPFLDSLARALLDGDLPRPGGRPLEPIDLPGVTLILPTRRAQRALGRAFQKASGRSAVLLPSIRAISDRIEAESLLSGYPDMAAPADDDSPGSAPMLPPMPALERLMALMTLVERWAQDVAQRRDAAGGKPVPPARTPAQAAALARELGGLLDLVETEGVSLDSIASLVPDEHAKHWEDTLDFLGVITQFWPAYRGASGTMTAAERRNAIIRAEARRLRRTPPKGPVIVAGVTGSIPATVDLMDAVLALEQGGVVLPGFDAEIDPVSWDALKAVPDDTAFLFGGGSDASKAGRDHPEHPQFGLRRLLDALGVARDDVVRLAPRSARPGLAERGRFISEAMRPTGITEAWHHWVAGADRDAVRAGLQDVHLIEAATALEESEAVALILREAVETPEKTIALVTPDRLLARRVAIRLSSWGIRVDDSAGRPFAKTVPGAFLNLVIEAIDSRFEPAATMALLKHPLCRLGLSARDVRLAARALEILAFRTVYTGEGLSGIAAALERSEIESADGRRQSRAAQRLGPQDRAAARDLVARLEDAFAPLSAAFEAASLMPPDALVRAHVASAEALSRLPAQDDRGGGDGAPAAMECGLYAGEAGEDAARLMAEIISASEVGPKVAARDYADLYRTLVSGHNVLPRIPVHPQIAILGIMEARLIDTDVMVLAGLNDGTWPDHTDPGPWLNRPMRTEIGLPALEEKIGYAAHDFTMFLAAPTIYLTRAKKVDGVPTVPSRWLLRIKALLEGIGASDALASDRPWLAWARLRDRNTPRRAIDTPRPCPPVEVRPRKIGASRVETLIANPYAIFAERICALEKLAPLGHQPDAALRGMIVHEALSRFAQRFPSALPDDIAAEVMMAADDFLDELKGSPRVRAFWRPRLQRFAWWFAETEPARRSGVTGQLSEADGSLTIAAPAGPFELTARADRIDLSPRGIVITDYKTGAAPKPKDVEAGRKPQLPLEAAIALAGGFGNLQPEDGARDGGLSVSALRYIKATGGVPAGEEKTVLENDVAAVAQRCLANFQALIARFDDPATPYAALRRAGFDYRYDDYAQLARVDEWSAGGEGDEGEA